MSRFFFFFFSVLGITPLASKMLATSSTQEHALDTETDSRSFSLGIESRLLALEYLSPADQFPIRGREKSLDNRSYLGIGAHQHFALGGAVSDPARRFRNAHHHGF